MKSDRFYPLITAVFVTALIVSNIIAVKQIQLGPFKLTAAQDKAVAEIAKDLARQRPMNRLLQGDVGSGKTIVAVYAVLAAIGNGLQAALMAPTEILAEQHFLTFQRILSRAGYEVALLVNAVAKKDKDRIRKEVAAGKICLVIGTHSLLSEKLNFTALSLAVIDEDKIIPGAMIF